MPEQSPTRVNPDLLALLICPVTQTALTLDKQRKELISVAAGLAYPIKNGLPVLLQEEARKLTPEELK